METDSPRIILNRSETTTQTNQVVWDRTIHYFVELEGRQIDFFQQKNGNDCGPCLCLNMQDALNAKSNADYVTDVKNFRRWATENSISGTNYSNGTWLTTYDIWNYIKNQLGLEQKTILKNRPQQPQTYQHQINIIRTNVTQNYDISVERLAQDKRIKFIWGVYTGNRNPHGEGNHFTGYLQTPNGIYLFDSLNESYRVKSQADLNDFIQNNVGVSVAFGPQSRVDTNSQTHNIPNINIENTTNSLSPSHQTPDKIRIHRRTDSHFSRGINKIKKILG